MHGTQMAHKWGVKVDNLNDEGWENDSEDCDFEECPRCGADIEPYGDCEECGFKPGSDCPGCGIAMDDMEAGQGMCSHCMAEVMKL